MIHLLCLSVKPQSSYLRYFIATCTIRFAYLQMALQAIQPGQQTMKHHPADAAKACNVTVNTVRNWRKDYSDFLRLFRKIK